MEETQLKPIGVNVKEKVMFVLLSIMALGQWADTKALLEETWVLVLSNFTHYYDYEAIDEIHIGNNTAFIEERFGVPHLIKNSKYFDDIDFHYYFNDKYILSLILKSERVTGYTITALSDSFVPYDMLDSDLVPQSHSIMANVNNFSDFNLDYNNVEFLVVSKTEGKEKLFLNRYFGAIDYLATDQLAHGSLKSLYEKVELEDEVTVDTRQDITMLAGATTNNFYGVGEVDLSVVSDSILTNFEISLYYKD